MTDEEQTPTPDPAAPQNQPPSEAPPAPAASQPASGKVITRADIEKNKTWALISYITLIGLIIALVGDGKESPFVRFHINQSLCLMIFAFAGSFISGIIPIVGWLLLGPIVGLLTIILAIMGIINASQGQVKRLPIIGNFDILN